MDLDEVVSSLSAEPAQTNTGHIPTGSLGLDLALGGGYRMGTIVELAGEPKTHKTQLALHTVAQAQNKGPVLWLDPQGEFSPVIARRAGVDPDNLAVHRPDDTCGALYHMRVCAPSFSLMVLDATYGLDFSESDYNEIELWFKWLKADIQPCTVALFVNMMNLRSYDYLGRAVRAWSSQHVYLHTKPGCVKATVRDNDTSPALHTVSLKFHHGSLFTPYELVHLGLETGVIRWRGSWLVTSTNTRLGPGVDNAARMLAAFPVIACAIREEIVKALS